VQTDGSWKIIDQHTLRYGLTTEQENATADTVSSVLPASASGVPTTDVRFNIYSSASNGGGLYVQDDWRILQIVTINGRLRFDGVDQFTHEHQISPRLKVAWKSSAGQGRGSILLLFY
jgi:outer membrane receptor for ferrienterochelin and colicin